MRYRVRDFKSVLLLAALLFVAAPQSFAQSQYRRSNSKDKQTNSVYKPDSDRNSRPQNGKKPPLIQQDRPGQNRPSQNRPSQNRPSQNRPKPNGPAAHRPVPPPGHNRPTPPPARPGGFTPRPSVHHYYGYYVNTLPFGARVIYRGPHTYYYADGRYYRFTDNRYIVCRPAMSAPLWRGTSCSSRRRVRPRRPAGVRARNAGRTSSRATRLGNGTDVRSEGTRAPLTGSQVCDGHRQWSGCPKRDAAIWKRCHGPSAGTDGRESLCRTHRFGEKPLRGPGPALRSI